MAFTLTYAQFAAELQNWTEDDSTEFATDALPGIAQRAHDRVQRDLDLAVFHDVSSVAIASTDETFARNSAWLKILSIEIPAEGALLDRRSYDYVRLYGNSGQPRFFAERGTDYIYFAPAADAAYTLSVEALKRTAFSSSNTTTWISINAADLLLLAGLMEAELFLKSPESMGEYAAAYQATLASAQAELRGVTREEYAPTRSAARPQITSGG